MPLTCNCEHDGEGWYYHPPKDFSTLDTSQRRRCASCGEPIDVGATAVRFERGRFPASDLEERIHGEEVPLAPKYLCEECGGLFFSLEDLGFCLTLGEDMRELVRQYAELYAPGKPRGPAIATNGSAGQAA